MKTIKKVLFVLFILTSAIGGLLYHFDLWDRQKGEEFFREHFRYRSPAHEKELKLFGNVELPCPFL